MLRSLLLALLRHIHVGFDRLYSLTGWRSNPNPKTVHVGYGRGISASRF